jgi:hypothetical protein
MVSAAIRIPAIDAIKGHESAYRRLVFEHMGCCSRRAVSSTWHVKMEMAVARLPENLGAGTR